MKPRLGNSFDYCIVGNAQSLAAKEVVHILQEAGFSVHCLDLNSILAGDNDLVADEFKAIVFLLENDEKQTRVMALVINRLAADPEHQRIISLKFDDLPDVELSPHLIIDLNGVNQKERKRRILDSLGAQRPVGRDPAAPDLVHQHVIINPTILEEDAEPDAFPSKTTVRPRLEPLETPARAPRYPPNVDLAKSADVDCKLGRLKELRSILLPRKDVVEFGVSHPTKVTMGVAFVVGVLVYRQEDRHPAVERAPKDNGGFVSAGATEVARKTKLNVELELPWPVEPKSQVVYWNGLVTNVPFLVVPNGVPATKALYGRAKISTNGLIIGLVPFKLMIDQRGSSASDTVISRAPAFKRAFASYASQDRRSVLARVQGIEKVGVNVFMDVHSLRANDKFNIRIFDEIDRSDVLYLFWSRHAKRSIWVEKEWRYGLTKKGLGFIDPVPLVDPRKASPPAELAAHKHFNDWALVYSEYERRRNLWTKLRTFVGN